MRTLSISSNLFFMFIVFGLFLTPPANLAENVRLNKNAPTGLPAASCGSLICDIDQILDTCPTGDPAIAEIRSDFEIRRNGILVGDISCSEPISQMLVSQYTDELIVLQGLRVIYYMDRGKSGHLPWTSGTLYDWMKSKIAGIDIRDDSGSFCCEDFAGKKFIAVGAQDDFNRDFDRMWEGISGNIALYAHETRHVDGFPHSSCCGIPGGCDDTYDEMNLTPYGVQWWLNKSWLMGDINVGFACLSASRIREITSWHLGSVSGFRNRFCMDKPPALSSPTSPGGECMCTVNFSPSEVNFFFDPSDPLPQLNNTVTITVGSDGPGEIMITSIEYIPDNDESSTGPLLEIIDVMGSVTPLTFKVRSLPKFIRPGVTLLPQGNIIACGKSTLSMKEVASRPLPVNSIRQPQVFSVPTLTQWGLIIMAFLLSAAGTVFIMRGQFMMGQIRTAGSGTELIRVKSQTLFELRVFSKTFMRVVVVMLIVFGALTRFLGSISILDIAGTLICALIFSYLVHLLIIAARGSFDR